MKTKQLFRRYLRNFLLLSLGQVVESLRFFALLLSKQLATVVKVETNNAFPSVQHTFINKVFALFTIEFKESELH